MNGLLHDGRRLAFAALLSAAAWLAATGYVYAQVGARVSPGPLSKAHTALEGTDNCQSCHDPKQAIAAPKCLTCHTPIAERIAAKKGVHRDVTDGCEGCHVEHAGLDADLRPLDPKTFEHAAETGFALVGRHAPLARECARCHKTRSFLENRPACASCHQAKDAHRGALGRDCERCHTPERWPSVVARVPQGGALPARGPAPHGRLRQLPRQRRHARHARPSASTATGSGARTTRTRRGWATSASSATGRRAGRRSTGTTRSRPAPRSAASTRRSAATRATRTVASWAAPSRVPAATCRTTSGRRSRTTRRPRFPLNCEVCHQPSHTSWNQAVFSHAAFPLVGRARDAAVRVAATRTASTRARRATASAATRPTTRRRPARTTRPPASRPPASSATSRRRPAGRARRSTTRPTSRWSGCTRRRRAAACHKNNVYKGTPRDCVGCHAADYQKTTSPNHAAAGFPTTCEQCHQPTASTWSTGSFNHATVYPLVGAHATQACAACHKNGVYKGTPRDCVGCHLADYQRTTNPNHAAAGFPTTCEQCHQQSATVAGAQRRRSTTPVDLPARRRPCHAGVRVVPQERRLQGHAARLRRLPPGQLPEDDEPEPRGGRVPDDVRAVPPAERAVVEPAAASTTRRSSRWSASTPRRRAPRATRTASTRARRATASAATRPTTRRRRTRTTPAAGFPTTCEQCHQASAPQWTASFNHNQFYPLLGRHLQQPCSACHKNNVYKGTPTACVACHQTNYNRTTNPNHAAAGFPTTCESCHKAGDTSWTQGVFNHTWFPITSGRHAGIACRTCHTTREQLPGVLVPDRVPRARGDRRRTTAATTTTGTTRRPATRATPPAARLARATEDEPDEADWRFAVVLFAAARRGRRPRGRRSARRGAGSPSSATARPRRATAPRTARSAS